MIDYLSNEIYITVGVSKIHGVGLIAIRDIPKDTDVLVAPSDEVINYVNDFEKWCFAMNKFELKEKIPAGVFNLMLSQHGEYDNTIYLKFIKDIKWHYQLYINHSDEPNSYYNSVSGLVTKTKILEGEELTVDYQLEIQKRK